MNLYIGCINSKRLVRKDRLQTHLPHCKGFMAKVLKRNEDLARQRIQKKRRIAPKRKETLGLG